MPKLIDEEKKRSQFVDAAWRVIHREGLEAATLRRVAAEAGYTTGALTRYFENREALFSEALRTAHFAASSRMAIVAQKSTNPLKRLEAIILEALPLNQTRRREWKTRLAFFNAASDSEALRRANAIYFEEWGQFLSKMLSPMIFDERTRKRDVFMLQALVDGLALRLIMESDGEDSSTVARLIRREVRLYLRALQAQH